MPVNIVKGCIRVRESVRATQDVTPRRVARNPTRRSRTLDIRRFSADFKTLVPGGHRGLFAVPIQLDRADLPTNDIDALVQRYHGLPILLNRSLAVVALYLDPHGAMDEHSAGEPILLLVIGGSGWVRIGGPDGETRAISVGDAVLWPAGLAHTIWTEDDPLRAIAIEGPAER